MIQDVKLGTHKIGTYMYAINKCALLLGFYLEMPLRSYESILIPCMPHFFIQINSNGSYSDTSDRKVKINLPRE